MASTTSGEHRSLCTTAVFASKATVTSDTPFTDSMARVTRGGQPTGHVMPVMSKVIWHCAIGSAGGGGGGRWGSSATGGSLAAQPRRRGSRTRACFTRGA